MTKSSALNQTWDIDIEKEMLLRQSPFSKPIIKIEVELKSYLGYGMDENRKEYGPHLVYAANEEKAKSIVFKSYEKKGIKLISVYVK